MGERSALKRREGLQNAIRMFMANNDSFACKISIKALKTPIFIGQRPQLF